MNTLRIFQTPAEFGQTAADVLAAQRGVEVISVNDLTMDLRIRGRNVQADLDAFYRAYRDAPEQQPAILLQLVESLTGAPVDPIEADPAVLLDRVLPMIKPLSIVNEVYERQLPMLAYRPLAGELLTTYVIDGGQSVAYINRQQLEAWGMSERALHERALANLRAKEWTPYPGVLGSGKGALLMLNGRDGYDATRLLLPELFGDFAAQLPGTLVIGVPNRDFLIAFSDADQRIFDQIKAQVALDAQTQSFSLTSQLFTFRDDQIVLYEA